ncbi:MAG TPA: glycosyltransferase family 4 protein, partial [Dehalococcoidia bacterium]|nr:glycosyltransferase family 4 protein [Dehalococcoidia bacterium]
MRVLFLTFQFPFPPDNGARIKTLSILEYLRPRHSLSVRCLTRQAPDAEQRRWADGFGDVGWAVLDRGRNPLNLARSYLSGVPLSVERNRSAEMSRLVGEAVGGGPYEAVFVDGWLMAQYLPEGLAGRKLLHEHNEEYVIWERQAGLDANAVRRLVTEGEARRVKAYEAGILPRFDAAFAVSEQDREALVAIGADPARTRVLPNVPEASLLDMPPLSFEDSQPVILYFGTLSWQPNIEGLERFIGEIFPLVRNESPQARLLVAGRGAPPELVRLGRGAPGVDFLGPAPDAEALYREARVFVEATRSGGGTKLKILNALARGLPVVASVEAAEGIEATAGEHLLIAADDETIAADTVRLLSDAALWAKLSANGQALVRAQYVAEKAF